MKTPLKPARAARLTERERVVQALAGRTFPRVGDVGMYYCESRSALVTVMKVDDVKFVTVRPVAPADRLLVGAVRVLRRMDDDGNGWYCDVAPPIGSEVAGSVTFRPKV